METAISLTSYLFAGIWFYAFASKWVNNSRFRYAMLNQAFPEWVGRILIWLLPFIELGTALLLIFKSTRLVGMYLSFVLVLTFTLYMAGAVLEFYERTPDPGMGLFKKMKWEKHLRINAVLLYLLFIVIFIMQYLETT